MKTQTKIMLTKVENEHDAMKQPKKATTGGGKINNTRAKARGIQKKKC
jgi:hypothetical protein